MKNLKNWKKFNESYHDEEVFFAESLENYFGGKARDGREPWIPVKLLKTDTGSYAVLIVAEEIDNYELYKLEMSGPKPNDIYEKTDFIHISDSDDISDLLDSGYEIVWENDNLEN